MANNNRNCNKKMQKVDSRPTLMIAEDSRKISMEKFQEMLRNVGASTQADNVCPQSGRDFAGYFLSSAKADHPNYGATSHNACEQLPSKMVLKFAGKQALRWNPTVETSSVDSHYPEPERNRLNCNYESCTSNRCTAKGLLGTTDKNLKIPSPQALKQYAGRPVVVNAGNCNPRTPATGRSGFRDNIMQFNDQSTMTVKLTNTCIGCMPSLSRHGSDAAATLSEIAVKETQGTMRLHNHPLIQKYRSPIPIRQKIISVECPSYSGESSSHSPCTSDMEEIECARSRYAVHPSYRREQPQGTTDEIEFESSQENRSTKSLSKSRRRRLSTDRKCSRKILYNEGISDTVAQQYPVSPVYSFNMPFQIGNSSAKSISTLEDESDQVPFRHRRPSKYHTNCKESRSRQLVLEREEARSPPSQAAVTSPFTSRKTKCRIHSAPVIQLPKRVLTSDRDIDAYVEAISYKKLCLPSRFIKK